MYTQSNAYVTKFSSGLLLALLAFSGFLIVLPFTPSVHASNASPPSITWNFQSFGGGSTDVPTSFLLTNPASNQYAITTFVLTAPTGWGIVDCDWGAGWFSSCRETGTSAGWTVTSGGSGIPPGSSQWLEVWLDFPTGTSYPIAGTFTSTVQDGSSAAFYKGPSVKMLTFDPTTNIVLTPHTGTTFTAGSGTVSFSAAITPAQAGIQIWWTVDPSGVPSTTTSYTDSTGTATMTFSPSNLVGVSDVYAILGADNCAPYYSNPGSCEEGWAVGDDAVTTVASTPSMVTLTLPGSGDSTAPNHYLLASASDAGHVAGATMAGSSFTVSLADKYTNAVAYQALDVLTLVAGNGRFNTPAAAPTATKTTITCADFTGAVCPTSGNSYTVGNAYFQPEVYGTIGTITAQLLRGTTTYVGVSGELITSTLNMTTSPTPAISGASIQAGSDVTVSGTTVAGPVTKGQQGIPVVLYLDKAASSLVHKDGKFVSSSALSIALTTDSSGAFTASYAVDTGAGATQKFVSNVTQPEDGAPTHTLGGSVDSAAVTTIAGPASLFTVYLFNYFYKTHEAATSTVFGATVTVDVQLVDAYGNNAVNSGVNQIQVTLAPTGGVLSATNVYIPSGGSDTNSSFGPIDWTVPSTAGSLTIKATGVINGVPETGSATLGVVSPLPTVSVLSPKPLSGVIYTSSLNPVFSGQANVSVGYPSNQFTIASVAYKIGSGHWTPTGAGGANQLTWSAAPTFVAGLNTIVFNATDSAAKPDVGVTPTYTVLVDSTAPTVAFTTTTGSTLTNGSPVAGTITVAEGDLNATSVTGTFNGTALAPSQIHITGTNNLGTSVTYQVAITGLTQGTWDLTLTASSLAGMTGSATPITVTVLLPPDLTFTAPLIQQTVVNGVSGVSVTVQNNGMASTASVWFQLLNPAANNVVVEGPTFVQTSFAAGQAETFFFALSPSLAHGSYTAQVFVTVNGQSYSNTFTVTVSV